jgi:hypothetical protein
MRKTLAILLSMAAFSANAEVITLTATSVPPSCKANQACYIHGYHEIHIINASLVPETFNYSYQLCLQGICDNAQNTVTVQPGQRWDNSRQSRLNVMLDRGKYTYVVRTECGKEKAHNDYTIKT